jgi:hypothetical protein
MILERSDNYHENLAMLDVRLSAGLISVEDWFNQALAMQDAAFAAMPIQVECSWCKGLIKPGKIEEISHSICPNCATEYFPGLNLSE